jgi:hypothetical protein
MTHDHYQECEDGLLELLRSRTDIFPKPWQVTDDEAARMRGGDNFFIVMPGPYPNTPMSTQEYLFQWVIVADLYVRYKEKALSLRKFKAVRASIIDLIFTHPTLDRKSNVQRVTVESDEMVQYFRFDQNAEVPNFVIQTMRVNVFQRIIFTGGEL